MDRPSSAHMRSVVTRKRQRGIVMVILAIGMLALLAMTGLALDSGHMFLTKTRLQNAVDASALGAARVLTSSGSMAAATAEARDIFSSNLDAPGNAQLDAAWADGGGEIALNVEFSASINPFAPTTAGEPPYVRVTAAGLTLDSWFVQVVGANDLPVGASAIAGPSAGLVGVCNIAPILACGCTPGVGGCCDPASGACSGDEYLEDSYPTSLVGPGNLTLDGVTGLSLPAGVNSPLGPGNFMALKLGANNGKSDLRDALAGNSDYCVETLASGDWVETEPGAAVDAFSRGLNARFDGSTRLGVPGDYLPEEMLESASDKLVILEDADGNSFVSTESGGTPAAGSVYDYEQYANEADSVAGCYATGNASCEKWRRMVVLPVGNCDGKTNGTSDPVQVHSYACFMLLQRVDHTGKRAVFGQFVPNPGGTTPGCDATGGISPNPSDYAPTKIVLYRDPNSGDS